MNELKIEAFTYKAADARTRDADEKVVKRVAAYCRVSTLQEEQDESYETQCAYYRRMVEGDPALSLVDVYGDHGISGLSTKARPEFQRMMSDCMDGKIDLVMTKSISRFARNLVDCLESVRLLREKGIPVLFEKESLNSMDPGCEMLLSVLATLAQEEINNLSQNIRWAREYRNASGDPMRAARYGYRKASKCGGKRREWRIYEPEAQRVRTAFEMASQGRSYREIEAALNDMERADRTGDCWPQTRIRSLLLSEIYIGDILTNKQYSMDYLSKRRIKNNGFRTQYYIEGHHEPIVDKALFDKVGALVRNRALRSAKRIKE